MNNLIFKVLKNTIKYGLLCIPLISSFSNAQEVTAPIAYEFTQDTYIKENAPETPKANDLVITIRNLNHNNAEHSGFFTFSLGGEFKPSANTQVILQLTAKLGRANTHVQLRDTSNNTWDEADLTWETSQDDEVAYGKVLATFPITATQGQTYHVDITQFVASQWADGNKTTYSFALTSEDSSSYFNFYSSHQRNSALQRPKVFIIPTGQIELLTKAATPVKAHAINMLNDTTHMYNFFYAWSNRDSFGGKYGYVDRDKQQNMQQSQATISSLDLSNVNLFNLFLGLDHDLPYTTGDIKHLQSYVKDGGGLMIFPTRGMGKEAKNAQTLLTIFGAKLSSKQYKGRVQAINGNKISSSAKYHRLVLNPKANWTVIATDDDEEPVIAMRKSGKGIITVGSFSPFIKTNVKQTKRADDYRFPNFVFNQWLMTKTASGKIVEPLAGYPKTIPPDRVKDMGSFEIRHTAYSAYVVDKVLSDYEVIYPILEKFIGVPMVSGTSDGEKFTIDLLAVAGAGVSRGKQIGIAMFKDNFFGILGHELTHSWVLPHPEPLSNEGIAIHIGTNVDTLANKATGTNKALSDNERTLDSRIERGRADPKFAQWDPVTMKAQASKFSKDVTFGKYLYILDEFENDFGDDIVAKYFKLKRKVVPATDFKFTIHDSVWLWSEATGKDQFEYFQDLGISADLSKVNITATPSFK